MGKILMKTSENELKNMFVLKVNAQSLNIYKIILHPAKPASIIRLKSCVTYVTLYKLHHPSNVFILEVSL